MNFGRLDAHCFAVHSIAVKKNADTVLKKQSLSSEWSCFWLFSIISLILHRYFLFENPVSPFVTS